MLRSELAFQGDAGLLVCFQRLFPLQSNSDD
jgi:hypothetical protein